MLVVVVERWRSMEDGAAVDAQGLTGEVRRAGTGEVGHERTHVVGVAEASGRDASQV
jgi:hypothetical protein